MYKFNWDILRCDAVEQESSIIEQTVIITSTLEDTAYETRAVDVISFNYGDTIDYIVKVGHIPKIILHNGLEYVFDESSRDTNRHTFILRKVKR